jgi:hypothetical protein
MGAGETDRYIRRAAAEIEHAAWTVTRKELRETFDESLVRFGEIGIGISARLLRIVHQFGFGNALDIFHGRTPTPPVTSYPATGIQAP